MPSHTWFVVAAFNESQSIGAVVRGVCEAGAKVVVVDDHSADDTLDRAVEAGAVGVRHPVNLGQGAALQTGIDFALRQGAEVVVTFDADGQHRVEDARVLAQAVATGETDVACGSRFLGLDADNMPRGRALLLRAAALFTRWTTGVAVTDAHNGLRALSRMAASKIRLTQNRMAHASEFVAQVRLRKLRFKEYPVKVLYTAYSMAKGQRWTNSFNILIDLFVGAISR